MHFEKQNPLVRIRNINGRGLLSHGQFQILRLVGAFCFDSRFLLRATTESELRGWFGRDHKSLDIAWRRLGSPHGSRRAVPKRVGCPNNSNMSATDVKLGHKTALRGRRQSIGYQIRKPPETQGPIALVRGRYSVISRNST